MVLLMLDSTATIVKRCTVAPPGPARHSRFFSPFRPLRMATRARLCFLLRPPVLLRAAAGKRKGKGKAQEPEKEKEGEGGTGSGGGAVHGGSADGGAGAEVRIDSSGRKRKKLTFAMEEYRSGLQRFVVVVDVVVVVVAVVAVGFVRRVAVLDVLALLSRWSVPYLLVLLRVPCAIHCSSVGRGSRTY